MLSVSSPILASQNKHKFAEFSQLWPQLRLAQPFSCEENSVSYFGNALLKALAVQALAPGNWVLADDSGLEVSELGGRPGIYSARYGGEDISAAERCSLLLKELGTQTERHARFVCCLVLLEPCGQFYAAQACAFGRISREPRHGTAQSFGYDPIFAVPDYGGQTYAQLEEGLKQKISHRSLALAKLRTLLLL